MSTTNYLNLNKHDNVTTNQNAFDIENYLNGNWDKIDQEASSQNTLIQRLKKNQIYGTATGTKIEITDSAETGASIGVCGVSEQDGEPSPENICEIKNLTGNAVCKVRGKNIFNIEDAINNMEWVQGGANINQYSMKLKPNTTYTLTTNCYNSSWCSVFLHLPNTDPGTLTNGCNPTRSVTTGADGILWVSLRIGPSSALIPTVENVTSGQYYIDLEEGSSIEEIEEYKEKTVTFPFSEGQALRKDGYLIANSIYNDRAGITLTRQNGNWSFGANFSNYNKIVVTARAGLSVAGSGTRTDFLCSHFKVDSTIYADNSNIGCYINSTGNINFAISYNTIEATSSNTNTELLELFLTWLDDNPITIEYELAEPTLTPYTTAQQEAYNNLQNLILFEGYNHIEMISPNGVKANLTVDYTKSTQMVINDIEERLSALEYAGLEG